MNNNKSIKTFSARLIKIYMSIFIRSRKHLKSIYEYLLKTIQGIQNIIDFLKNIFVGLQFYSETSLITNPRDLQGVRIDYER